MAKKTKTKRRQGQRITTEELEKFERALREMREEITEKFRRSTRPDSLSRLKPCDW